MIAGCQFVLVDQSQLIPFVVDFYQILDLLLKLVQVAFGILLQSLLGAIQTLDLVFQTLGDFLLRRYRLHGHALVGIEGYAAATAHRTGIEEGTARGNVAGVDSHFPTLDDHLRHTLYGVLCAVDTGVLCLLGDDRGSGLHTTRTAHTLYGHLIASDDDGTASGGIEHAAHVHVADYNLRC